MKKYSLVLEGGGAKGAYQVGAIKALKENGYEFDTVIGTSIGAINAAFICQGDFENLEKLWQTLSFQDLMDINNDIAKSLLNVELTYTVILETAKKVKKAFKDRGIDTKYMRDLLERYIDEEKIRKSDLRFGLVTYCLSDMTPQELFIEDIPDGKLVDYLLATSNLPVFKRQKIDDKKFLDGGIYDNCSVEMLYKAGYRDIVAIRLNQKNKIKNYSKITKKGRKSEGKKLNLKTIVPSEELPFLLDFSTETLNNLLEYGYVDAIKQIKNLDGRIYALEKISKEDIEKIKEIFTPKLSIKLQEYLNLKLKVGQNIVDVIENQGMYKLSSNLLDLKTKNFKKQIISIVEYVANKEGVSKNKIYTFDVLVVKTQESLEFSTKKYKGLEEAARIIVENIGK